MPSKEIIKAIAKQLGVNQAEVRALVLNRQSEIRFNRIQRQKRKKAELAAQAAQQEVSQ